MNNPFRPALLAEYPVAIRLPVQWGDQDAFGHVNNTVYFRWYESARIAYLEQSGLEAVADAAGLGPILANISCNYRLQLTYPDAVWIGARITRIGKSSMNMEHAIFSERLQQMAAQGDSVIVMFDYQANASCPVPPAAREAISRTEGKAL